MQHPCCPAQLRASFGPQSGLVHKASKHDRPYGIMHVVGAQTGPDSILTDQAFRSTPMLAVSLKRATGHCNRA